MTEELKPCVEELGFIEAAATMLRKAIEAGDKRSDLLFRIDEIIEHSRRQPYE